jgi:hypothetical protein
MSDVTKIINVIRWYWKIIFRRLCNSSKKSGAKILIENKAWLHFPFPPNSLKQNLIWRPKHNTSLLLHLQIHFPHTAPNQILNPSFFNFLQPDPNPFRKKTNHHEGPVSENEGGSHSKGRPSFLLLSRMGPASPTSCNCLFFRCVRLDS